MLYLFQCESTSLSSFTTCYPGGKEFMLNHDYWLLIGNVSCKYMLPAAEGCYSIFCGIKCINQNEGVIVIWLNVSHW